MLVEKEAFWSDLEILVQEIPTNEFIFIGADMNGHVGETNVGFEECHGGFGYGSINDEGRRRTIELCQILWFDTS